MRSLDEEPRAEEQGKPRTGAENKNTLPYPGERVLFAHQRSESSIRVVRCHPDQRSESSVRVPSRPSELVRRCYLRPADGGRRALCLGAAWRSKRSTYKVQTGPSPLDSKFRVQARPEVRRWHSPRRLPSVEGKRRFVCQEAQGASVEIGLVHVEIVEMGESRVEPLLARRPLNIYVLEPHTEHHTIWVGGWGGCSR